MKKIIYCLLMISVVISSPALAKDSYTNWSSGQVVHLVASYQCYKDSENLCQNRDTSRTRFHVRNLSPTNSIQIDSIKWGNPDGAIVEELIDAPITLEAFASMSMITSPDTIETPPFDFNDGRPFFLIEWSSSEKVIPPKITCVVVGLNPYYEVQGFLAGDSTVLTEK